MYNKLFTKILDSSIWLESKPTRIVWVTFIAVMDEHGFCQFATVENVARRANVTTAEAEKAIATLEGPDPHSSDPDNEGRRLERVPGGWVVRNAEKYRSLVKRHLVQEQTAERVRRHRAKAKKQKTIKQKTAALHGNAPVTPSETESEARSKAEGEWKNAPPPRQGALMSSHARCASHVAGFCVPERLHESLKGKCRGMSDVDADRHVSAFYAAVEADQRWQGTIGEADVFRFLNARWTEQHGGAAKKSDRELRAEAVRRELLGESV